MAPTNTRLASKEKPNHQISESEDSEGDNTKEESPQDPFGLSTSQLEAVSLLVKSAVTAAVAQVLPIAHQNSQVAMGFASPGTSAQLGMSGSSPLPGQQQQESREDGECPPVDEEMDEYERSLLALLGDTKLTGPEISEKVGRVLQRTLGNPLDEKVVKMKREEYPRPENVNNPQVPRTNPIIFKKATTDHQVLDRGLQATQSYLVGGITAMGRQAEKLLGLRTWAANLEQAEKDRLPEQVSQLTGMYIHLMDSLIMLVRAMGDLTNIRRRMFKNDLVDPYKALMDDEKNPPTAEWLAGEDVHGAIRKAKANASLADDIGKRNKWPKKPFGKNYRNNKPYDHQNNQRRNSNAGRSEHDSHRGGYRGSRGQRRL